MIEVTKANDGKTFSVNEKNINKIDDLLDETDIPGKSKIVKSNGDIYIVAETRGELDHKINKQQYDR